MQTIYKRSLNSEKLEVQEKLTKGSWIHFSNPSKEDYEYFRSLTGVDDDFMEGILDEHEHPRLEKYSDKVAVLIQIPFRSSGVKTIPLAIILTDKYVVTLCSASISLSNFMKDEDLYTTQKNKFLFILLSYVESEYTRFLRAIAKTVKQKKVVLGSLNNSDVIHLVELEDELNYFLSSMLPNASLFESLRRGHIIKVFEDDKELIEELLISTKQNLDECRSVIKTVQNVRNAYSTILTNNLNKVMKVLTLFTVMLTIPMLISSIYGMNIPLPMQNSPHMFTFFVGACLLLLLLVGFIFYKKRLL